MGVSQNWKNLRSFLQRTHNRRVNEWFRDVDDPVPDNSSSRRQAKRACLILPNESQNMALLKRNIFLYEVMQIHLQQNHYGIPIDTVQESKTFRPQVHLFFRQDASATANGRRAIEGQVSFRLINETSESLTEAKARTLAVKIKNEFTRNNGLIWKKGSKKYTYKDDAKGVDLRILAISETEGEKVIRAVLDVLDVTFDNDHFQEITPKRTSENNPAGTNLVYGKRRKKQRWRPTANVRFRYAALTVHGMQNRIVLVDRTNTFYNALEWA